MRRLTQLWAITSVIAWSPIRTQVVDVWPGVAPGSERWTQQERTIEATPVGTVVLNEVKRAGLDYWEHVDVRTGPSWEEFERELPALGEPWFFSTKGKQVYWEAPLGEARDVVLVFGRETGGLPDELHERYADRMIAMP